jgi:hypothetical protein
MVGRQDIQFLEQLAREFDARQSARLDEAQYSGAFV